MPGSFVQWVIAVLLIPGIVVLFRGMVRWVRTEDKLDKLVDSVNRLVQDKDRTHADLMQQMTFDREATNKRLRFLEEYFMAHGMGRGEQRLCRTKSGNPETTGKSSTRKRVRLKPPMSLRMPKERQSCR